MFYIGKNQLARQGKTLAKTKQLDWSSRFASLAKTSKYPALKAFYQQSVIAASTPMAEVPMVAWIIKPETNLHTASVVVHGITHSAVADAPDFSNVIDTLLGCLQGKIVVAHHAPIERRFLHAALMRHIQEGIEFPVIDTMAIEAQFSRRKSQEIWRSLLGRQRTSIRLTDSRTRYHLPYYRQHNALTDAIACAELLQAQCVTHLTHDTPVSAIWS